MLGFLAMSPYFFAEKDLVMGTNRAVTHSLSPGIFTQARQLAFLLFFPLIRLTLFPPSLRLQKSEGQKSPVFFLFQPRLNVVEMYICGLVWVAWPFRAAGLASPSLLSYFHITQQD